MRAALISIAGNPAPVIGGKTLARRQLDFALAAGCERVLVLGNGGSAEAIALRHVAESAGASFQAFGDSHALLGSVRAADEVLLLAPGLLAEAPEAIGLLARRGVLVVPAGEGVAAGFERIDAERAWSGAALVPGSLIERLADLPADSEPASALMRAALQARVPERRLPPARIADGSWAMVGQRADAAAIERVWLERNLALTPSAPISKQATERALRVVAPRLLALPQAVAAISAVAVVLLAGGVAAAGSGFPAPGLVAAALGSLLVGCALGLRRLRDAPHGGPAPRWMRLLPWIVDLALAACAAFAIDGGWLHRLFPPLVLVAGLHLGASRWLASMLSDRALLALGFAVAAGFGAIEPAVMLAALTLILLNIARGGERSA